MKIVPFSALVSPHVSLNWKETCGVYFIFKQKGCRFGQPAGGDVAIALFVFVKFAHQHHYKDDRYGN